MKKVQAITGYKTERLTEWYTHFDPTDFGEVPKIQEQLLKPIKEPANDEVYACKS